MINYSNYTNIFYQKEMIYRLFQRKVFLWAGMTNRKDMIDDALLRPGRLEVQVEIGLPKEKGRVDILNIHTSTMRSVTSPPTPLGQ